MIDGGVDNSGREAVVVEGGTWSGSWDPEGPVCPDFDGGRTGETRVHSG